MPRATVLQLFMGASYPLRALHFLWRHQLWSLALWAVAVNVGLLIMAVWAALTWALPAASALVNEAVHVAPQLFAGQRLALGPALEGMVGWAVWLLCLPLVLFASTAWVLKGGQLLASPVLDRLSERCENIVLHTAPAPWRWRQAFDALLFTLSDQLWALLGGVGGWLPRLLWALIPGVGVWVLWAMAARALAQDFVGLPLSRQLMPSRERAKAVMGQPALSLGFGGATHLLLMVPGLNLVLLPLACIGGTLLYCDLVRYGFIVPRPHPPEGLASTPRS